jgi:hypothetical protein
MMKKYWREIIIGVLALLLVFPFWRNHLTPPCPVITQVRTVTDTCWLTVTEKPRRVFVYKMKYDTSIIYANLVQYDTLFLDKNPDQKVYIDTLHIGRSQLAYAHLVTGTIDSSIYSLMTTPDTVVYEVDRPKIIYREPFLNVFATAKTQGDNFAPGIALQRNNWMAGYGFDLIRGRHELMIGYRIGKIK